MTAPVLTLRISRRAVAAVVLDDERLAFCDGRHLRSNKAAVQNSALRYLTLVLDQVRPAKVVIDCPFKTGGQTEVIWTALLALLTTRGVAVTRVTVGALLEAFALPGLPSRRALRDVVARLFSSDFAALRGAVKPFMLEAAAAALWADTTTALGEPAT
jgi:hypothetical protein